MWLEGRTRRRRVRAHSWPALGQALQLVVTTMESRVDKVLGRLSAPAPPPILDLKLPSQVDLGVYDRLLVIDDLGYLLQGAEESEVLFTLIAERYERRSLGITSNLVFSEWEKVFANSMATAAAKDRIVPPLGDPGV